MPPEIRSSSAADQERQAEREEESVIGAGAARNAEPHPDEQREDQIDRGEAEEAPVFAQDGDDQIGVAGRDDVGFAESRAGSQRAAGSHGPERMRHLIAAAHRSCSMAKATWRRGREPSSECRESSRSGSRRAGRRGRATARGTRLRAIA